MLALSRVGIQHVCINTNCPLTMKASNAVNESAYDVVSTEPASSVPSFGNGATCASPSSRGTAPRRRDESHGCSTGAGYASNLGGKAFRR